MESGGQQRHAGSGLVNVRCAAGHAFGLRYVTSTRNARYGKLPNVHSVEGTITFAYSFLGSDHFGAVKR
jgi:hypothetical protein